MTSAQFVCPDCGASNVRLRRRRWYDYVRTWGRFVLDSLGSPSTRGVSSTGRGNTTSHAQDMLAANEYSEYRDAYEARLGTATAQYFWKCRSCGKRGQVFGRGDLDRELGTGRTLLAERERDIESRMGSAGRPAGPPVGPDDS